MYEVVNLFLFQSYSYFRMNIVSFIVPCKATITKSIYGIPHTTPVPA